MDTKIIIGGGVLLGAFILLSAKSSAPTSNSDALGVAALQAQGTMAGAAPGIIAAQAENNQFILAASNAHDQSFYDLIAKLDTNQVQSNLSAMQFGQNVISLNDASKATTQQYELDKLKTNLNYDSVIKSLSNNFLVQKEQLDNQLATDSAAIASNQYLGSKSLDVTNLNNQLNNSATINWQKIQQILGLAQLDTAQLMNQQNANRDLAIAQTGLMMAKDATDAATVAMIGNSLTSIVNNAVSSYA